MFPSQIFGLNEDTNKPSPFIRDHGKGLVIISYNHYKIHKEDSFEWSDRWTGLNSGNKDYLIVCGTRDLHFSIIRIAHTNDVDILTYKNPVVSANGTEVSAKGNRHWGSDVVASAKVYVGPTVTSVGDLRNGESSFSNNNVSTAILETEVRVINPGQSALMRITRVAGTVSGSIRILAHESD